MKIQINNDKILIQDPTAILRNHLIKNLSYTDKAKQYQAKRMSKNTFLRQSQKYKELLKEVHNCLVDELPNGDIQIPSGFYHLFDDKSSIIDQRRDTGSKISLPWSKKPFDMREYQKEAHDLMENNFRGLINFATGLGKTLTAVYFIRSFAHKTLIVCPNKSVANQFYEELCNAFGEHKIGYCGDSKFKIRDVTVGIVGTIKNNLTKFKNADLGLIIFDEVHHIAADTFYAIADELSTIGRIFGLTATDFRNDGKDVLITAGVGSTIIRRDLIWGIKEKWLADPYFIIRSVQTTGTSFKDDKLKNYKQHVLNSKIMTDRIIHDIDSFIKSGKSVLCLVDEVEHGTTISQRLGLSFATGKDDDSDKYVKDLNNGKISGLIATDSKIGEGVDTRRVDVLIMANFVASKGTVWQNLGRGLRIYPGKKYLIVLDYIPTGSEMLKRHANQRISYYKEITSNVKVI
jgi:superfamily II DNA or RNA helicase